MSDWSPDDVLALARGLGCKPVSWDTTTLQRDSPEGAYDEFWRVGTCDAVDIPEQPLIYLSAPGIPFIGWARCPEDAAAWLLREVGVMEYDSETAATLFPRRSAA
jgi:hypothetical protein